MTDSTTETNVAARPHRRTAAQNEQQVNLADVQGRPMLQWQGKSTPSSIVARPAQQTDAFDPADTLDRDPANRELWADWPAAYPPAGLLFYGDNKDVLANLLANGFRGKVNLIYIDPPFDSGADYIRSVQLRGIASVGNLEAEGQSVIEQKQYQDIWANDLYLQFMYERLILLKELLTDNGVIYLHCDHRKEHHLRMLLDEVFGPDNYLNTISWRSQVPRGAKVEAFYYPYSTHYIHIYAKGNDEQAHPIWHPQKNEVVISLEEAERDYQHDDKGYFRTSDPGSYSFASLLRLYSEGRVYVTKGGEVAINEEARTFATTKGTIGIKYYLKPDGNGNYVVEKGVDNLWDDIPGLGTTPSEGLTYPTQKTEGLLERIILASSNPGSIVLDCFSGSGTTVAVAQKLGRRWIAADLNRGALQTTNHRLQTIINEQLATGGQQNGLPGITPTNGNGNGKKRKGKNGNGDIPAPAQLAFTIARVNNYKLDIPYDEAIDLACKAVGATRDRADGFFEGKRGSQLVKIVSFDHPLGPLDLEGIKRELEKRGGNEERNVLVICHGKQVASDEWLATWNRYRAVTRLDEHTNQPIDFVNKIEVIDLETDAKYGGFLSERPPEAEVSISRHGGEIRVKIDEFISPTIVKKLNMDITYFTTLVTDWRSMVNSVEIDTNYDGEVFNIVYSDIPERKNDLVKGEYTLPTPEGPTTVAVRITDMLGQDVVIKERI